LCSGHSRLHRTTPHNNTPTGQAYKDWRALTMRKIKLHQAQRKQLTKRGDSV
jgi:hypothetical protein